MSTLRSFTRTRPAAILTALAAAFAIGSTVNAQPFGDTFTYQGELIENGLPVNGEYDLQFKLYNAAVGGTPLGTTACANNVTVVNGRFTVNVAFSGQFDGQARFLEISTRPGASGNCSITTGWTLLSGRQELKPTPHAVFAAEADRFGGNTPAFYLNAGNLATGTIPDARLPASLARTNAAQTFSAAQTFGTASFTNASGTFSGDGAGLNNLNATNLNSGTVPNARLAATVARTNAAQTFSAAQTFATASFTIATFTNASGTFSGDGAGLNSLNANNLATGTVPNARLAATIARTNTAQTFSAAQTFGTASFTNASGTFSGDGAGLINLNAANVASGTLPLARGGTGTASVNLPTQQYDMPFFDGGSQLQYFGTGGSTTSILRTNASTGAPQWVDLASSGLAQLTGNNLFTGQMIINIGSGIQTGLRINAATGQTVDILRAFDADGQLAMSLSPSGNFSANGFRYRTGVSRVVSISPTACVPESSTAAFSFSPDLQVPIGGGTVTFYYPIDLPNDVNITSLELNFFDQSGAEDIEFRLMRRIPTSPNTGLSLVSHLSLNSPTTQTITLPMAFVNVERDNYAYTLEVTMDANLAGGLRRFFGARITYTQVTIE